MKKKVADRQKTYLYIDHHPYFKDSTSLPVEGTNDVAKRMAKFISILEKQGLLTPVSPRYCLARSFSFFDHMSKTSAPKIIQGSKKSATHIVKGQNPETEHFGVYRPEFTGISKKPIKPRLYRHGKLPIKLPSAVSIRRLKKALDEVHEAVAMIIKNEKTEGKR
jgi:hypothetical protein